LETFWTALKNAKPIESFLFLPDTEDPYLFICKSYSDLAEIIFNNKMKNICITGNPGIGKSFFGHYLFHRLAQEGKTIVYDEVNSNPVLFCEELVSCGQDLFEFRKYLNDSNTWYIVDGHHPTKYNARTILVCSPQKNHYKNFDKWGRNIIRIMPVWDSEEIETCRSKIFNHLEKNKVDELFSKWGGIPWFILENANNEFKQLKLQQAIDSCDQDISKYINIDKSDSKEDISSILSQTSQLKKMKAMQSLKRLKMVGRLNMSMRNHICRTL